jgi:predicted ATP-dependent Lon-type protease
MTIIEKMLEKTGLKYDDLTPDEKETLNSMLDIVGKSALSVEKIRTYINEMKDAVEKELSKMDFDTRQDIFLKARLRNYLLLSAFLSTPEKAKEQLENSVSGMVKK